MRPLTAWCCSGIPAALYSGPEACCVPGRLGVHLFPHGHSLCSIHDHPNFRAAFYPLATGSTAIRRTIFPKEPPSQIALGQRQPVIAGVFHQPSNGIHQPAAASWSATSSRFAWTRPAAATKSPGCRSAGSGRAALGLSGNDDNSAAPLLVKPHSTPGRQATSTNLSTTSPAPADADSIARDITSLVIERLQRTPSEARREVWRQAKEHVEAEGVIPETQEVPHTAAA